MILENLRLDGFRNLQDVSLTFGRTANVIAGANGQGKSNLLEAIGFLSVFRSFRTAYDAEIARFDIDNFVIEGIFDSGSALNHEVHVRYKKGVGKKVIVDAEPVSRLSSVVGFFPTICLGIEQFPIITGGPRERRRFLDMALSQMSPLYLSALMRYKRAVHQRNSLLSSGDDSVLRSDLPSWDAILVESGVEVIAGRNRFLEQLQAPAQVVYQAITGNEDTVPLNIRYRPDIKPDKDIRETFVKRLERDRPKELLQRRSLAGPHRDDFLIQIGDRGLRKHGSQGEQKSALFALKMAEMQLLQDLKNFTPTVLIDDLFSMLDHTRVSGTLQAIREAAQVFITTTDGDSAVHQLRQAGFSPDAIARYNVHNGVVTRETV
jgi:DNA replication and repair protein RecF